MKFYTDINQSKKLAEILPIESADMWWSKNFIYYNLTAAIGISAEYSDVYTYKFGEDDIPCWSLAALLSVLPRGVNISTPKPTNELGYCCWNQYDEIYASNPVDACYEMIIKLNEQKLL